MTMHVGTFFSVCLLSCRLEVNAEPVLYCYSHLVDNPRTHCASIGLTTKATPRLSASSHEVAMKLLLINFLTLPH